MLRVLSKIRSSTYFHFPSYEQSSFPTPLLNLHSHLPLPSLNHSNSQTFNSFFLTFSTNSSLKKTEPQEPLGKVQRFFGEMNSKHLATGSTCPEWDGKKLRIYTMRFCPYAQRASLVAAAKEADMDLVNVNLLYKPEWLFEKNPLGKVPILETKEGYIYESIVVSEYIDEVIKPEIPLQASDPFKRAQDRMWIERFSPISTLWVKLIIAKVDPEAQSKIVTEITEILTAFEKELGRRGTPFFGGTDKPGFFDYMIWPWIERIPALKVLIPNLFDLETAKQQNPNLDRWRHAMKEDPAVKFTIIPTDIHVKFIEKHLSGNTDYDMMSKEN